MRHWREADPPAVPGRPAARDELARPDGAARRRPATWPAPTAGGALPARRSPRGDGRSRCHRCSTGKPVQWSAARAPGRSPPTANGYSTPTTTCRSSATATPRPKAVSSQPAAQHPLALPPRAGGRARGAAARHRAQAAARHVTSSTPAARRTSSRGGSRRVHRARGRDRDVVRLPRRQRSRSPTSRPRSGPAGHRPRVDTPRRGRPRTTAETARAIAARSRPRRGARRRILDRGFTSDGVAPRARRLPGDRATHARRRRLCVADEVQAGYGRAASTCGFRAGITPDIVTLGKPMGNGYPVAAVVTRRELVDGTARTTEYFSTFGGTRWRRGRARRPGRDRRRAPGRNAAEVGDALAGAAARRRGRHPRVGEVRGPGCCRRRVVDARGEAEAARAAVVNGARARRPDRRDGPDVGRPQDPAAALVSASTRRGAHWLTCWRSLCADPRRI